MKPEIRRVSEEVTAVCADGPIPLMILLREIDAQACDVLKEVMGIANLIGCSEPQHELKAQDVPYSARAFLDAILRRLLDTKRLSGRILEDIGTVSD